MFDLPNGSFWKHFCIQQAIHLLQKVVKVGHVCFEESLTAGVDASRPLRIFALSDSIFKTKMAALISDVKLATNASERTYYDNLGDLYSIFVTTELLEKAYVRDSVTASECVSPEQFDDKYFVFLIRFST
jgi:hypothetical protein